VEKAQNHERREGVIGKKDAPLYVAKHTEGKREEGVIDEKGKGRGGQ